VRGHLGTRIAQIIPTLLLVSVLVFCLQQLMPGDPALVMAGEERGDPQVLAQIRAELWLDRPLPVQYLHWMGTCCKAISGIRGASVSRCRSLSQRSCR
jgi:ABC-type dipeptide/oligopeptide/nickel transport system permease component